MARFGLARTALAGPVNPTPHCKGGDAMEFDPVFGCFVALPAGPGYEADLGELGRRVAEHLADQAADKGL